MNNPARSNFHAGEIAIQTRAGVAERVARFGQKLIRPELPDEHREFYQHLPFIILGMLDPGGHPWAIPVFGEIGFIQSPTPKELSISGLPLFADQIGVSTEPGTKVGVLGIELQTRRRNRMNGILAASEPHTLKIQVEQSYGNCPQYIQTRELKWRKDPAQDLSNLEVTTSPEMSPQARKLIERADTFFIASRTKDIESDSRSGVDASHRGGKPGFVRVNPAGVLAFPDFQGNNFFNTLGNIQTDPRVGLFFPDFETGDVVLVSGSAEIIWDGDRVAAYQGAQRIVEVTPDKIMFSSEVLAVEGRLLALSPTLEKTGSW